jgi:DMSO/TMAO reductase YedYZ heme-binding membrane subunit
MSDISGPGGTGARGKLGTPELIIVIAGAVALVGSFLDWFEVAGFGGNAWSDDLAFPTYAWVGIFGAVMAAQIALTSFANVDLPSDILGFTWSQIHLVLAFFCVLLTLSFLIGGEEQAIGFYLSLLASIALLVGAVMLRNEAAPRAV